MLIVLFATMTMEPLTYHKIAAAQKNYYKKPRFQNALSWIRNKFILNDMIKNSF